MAVLDPNAVYEVTVRGSANNQAILNVFHYQVEEPLSDPGANGTEENFLAEVKEAWDATVLPKLWVGYGVESYNLKRITGTEPVPPPGTGNRLIVPFQFAIPGTIDELGTRTGEPLPTYSAVGYRKRTPNPSRNGRGAFRLGPVMEEDTTGGNALNAGAVALFSPASLEPLRRVLITIAASFPMEMVVFSETLALLTPNTTPRLFAFEVQTIQLNPFITTQNTRKQRVGAN